MHFDDSNIGWENGARVPVSPAQVDCGEVEEGGGLLAVGRGRTVLWPSAEEVALELHELSAMEAAKIANAARLELMESIAGAGVEPVWIVMRTLEAAMLSGAMATGTWWPGRAVAQALMNGYAAALPVVGTLLYGKKRKRKVAAAQSRIRGVCGRHGWGPVRREAAEGGFAASRDEGRERLCRVERRGDEGRGSDSDLDSRHSGAAASTLDSPDSPDARRSAEEHAVAALARTRLLCWLCVEESATAVVQRWWAMAWTGYRSVIGPLSGEDIGAICGYGRATVHEWVVRYLGDPSRMVTGVKIEVAGMKPDTATPFYAANAAKHKPSRQLEGAAGLDGDEAEQMAVEAEKQLAAYRTRQRALWEARQVERDAEAFEEMTRRNRARRGKLFSE